MGCGRSRLQIFQSANTAKKRKKKKQEEMVVESVDNVEEVNSFDIHSPEAAFARRAAAIARFRQISQGPLLAMAEVSRSQTEFFRMLDEKIENGPDFEYNEEILRSRSPSVDNKPRRLSLLNGHRGSGHSLKFHSQGVVTSSPTRCKTPQQQNMSPKHRLPTLQASPPPRDPNRRSSPTHILSLALASPLKVGTHGSPHRVFGSNKIFKSEELASRYD